MAGLLEREIQQAGRKFGKAEAVLLNLLRSANRIDQQLGQFLRTFELTPAQYNVLRILQGSSPESLPCSEIGERLVSPVPDVTRLLDRLERKGLVARERSHRDRRVVEIKISQAGSSLVRRVEGPLSNWTDTAFSHLSVNQKDSLIRLLERVRTPESDIDPQPAAK